MHYFCSREKKTHFDNKKQMKIQSFFNNLQHLGRTFVLIVSVLALTTQAKAQDAAKGETIFTQNCKVCHAPTDEKVIGPGLKDVNKRRDIAWITKWVKNPAAVIASGDQYANDLYNKYNKTQMTAFSNYGEAEIKDILAYIEKVNAAPVAVAGSPTTTGTTTAAAGNSDLFTYILVAVLLVMLLVLGVLLSIMSLLTKATKTEGVAGATGETLLEKLRNGLMAMGKNPAIRSAVIWFFILLGLKATIDGAYSIGVQQGYAPKQPIQFSHKLHAGQYKIDCNYCHTGVNRNKSAVIPSANICMNCHGVIKKESPQIQKIYAAIENNQPIQWVRVHNLPDLAYFNHAQHVNVGGINCTTCHGEIAKMEVVEQRSSLTMGWCIDCHRQTEVNTKDNKYYDKLVEMHKNKSKEPLKVADIGGLECSKCHY